MSLHIQFEPRTVTGVTDITWSPTTFVACEQVERILEQTYTKIRSSFPISWRKWLMSRFHPECYRCCWWVFGYHIRDLVLQPRNLSQQGFQLVCGCRTLRSKQDSSAEVTNSIPDISKTWVNGPFETDHTVLTQTDSPARVVVRVTSEKKIQNS